MCVCVYGSNVLNYRKKRSKKDLKKKLVQIKGSVVYFISYQNVK